MVDNTEREAIKKIALLNALNYGGKAQFQPVLGKLLTEQPQLKTKIKEIAPIIQGIVAEVNKLPIEKQKKIVEEKWPEALVKTRVEVERTLPSLSNVDKYERVVTRFAPNPDCMLHLGSARAIVLCDEYAKMYNGSFRVRLEDTDPRLKRSALPFYAAIPVDLKWLGCKWDMEVIQSDRLPAYYEYAEKLLASGAAYVCACTSEKFRKLITTKKPCPCRDLPASEHLARWKYMLNGTYKEGEAVVRIKTDLKHPNPAVRDWPALRIINPKKYPHPRVGDKYRVWPLYNFSAGVDDHLMGVTHIIRGKEHLANQTRQEYMYEHLGWHYPEAIHYGRMKIVGGLLSKSKIVEGVKKGAFTGWDDPRLATFIALRKRGILPETIRRLIIEVGPKTVDVTLSWENLYAVNRKLLDPITDRYFFVRDPRKLKVTKIPEVTLAHLPLHPDNSKRGFREFRIEPQKGAAEFWIATQDANLLKNGQIVRLMGLFNMRIEDVEAGVVEASFHSKGHEEARKLGAPLIHWLPVGTGIPCEVVMPDATVARGIAEDTCRQLKPDTTVQFERFGFARIDSIEWKLTAYYAHR
ncbi:MAG TPA: glutamate--tRNA ligase [Candidatus Bathyarchaeia archaeon]|nr:glutamate--tRNA ligase [Candidatus Bathyarchaeia archaeon]